MTGCSNGSNSGKAFLPQRNPRDRRADVGRGDDGEDAAPRPGGAGLDAADASVRNGAAQDRGVQKIIAGEVVDELAAAAQEAKVLDPFDRAADKGVARALLVHAAVVVPMGSATPLLTPRAPLDSDGSYHDRRMPVEQRAGDAERRQGRRLGIGARGLALQLDGKPPGLALGLDLVDIA